MRDSHVFDAVTYSRTKAKRMAPDPLDVAYAAFANDQALSLLPASPESQGYAEELREVRTLIDRNDASFWHSSMYNEWLSALRSLSPMREARSQELPTVAGTEAWGRRLVATQLASWAQLRHDSILAKLFYAGDPLSFEPTIADVHTQPTDENGQVIGRVLHVATELPRAMVVTLDGCQGSPRAYVGLVASYRERVTHGFQRLTDEAWASELEHKPAPAPAWLAELSAPVHP